MRLALCLIFFAAPLHAWEFSAQPVCTLSHDTPGASVRVTHDPRQAEPYAISVAGTEPWPDAPAFSIRFDGPRGLTISTTRHRREDGGTTLTVTDQGFGNVLDGLEFNASATAQSGGTELTVSLTGAAPAVRAFRACAVAVLS